MRQARRGGTIMEAALFIPVLVLLIVGMVQFGKITYVYYTLKKTLYTAGRYVATAQAVDFCSGESSEVIQAAKLYALTGTTDGSVDSFLASLTPDMISVQAECVDPSTGAVGECLPVDCEIASGAERPDFVVVSIPGGYEVQPRIPFLLLDPIPLRPEVRVPFGGT